eukprot:TRINITY_DN1012_c0_g3_i2.p2 TRINITY_DN1012_c0_g3~~TRINITY_DN1012_c0_g3_i2.p2  ORF type:complete len:220 (+),score=42.16 TRINITY_DN1012_c0_g3_i2:60-719(+)
MSNITDVYERDCKEHLRLAQEVLALLSQCDSYDVATRKQVMEGYEALDCATDAVRSMEPECVNNLELKKRIAEFKKEINKNKREMEKSELKLKRKQLFDGSGGGGGGTGGDVDDEDFDHKGFMNDQTRRTDEQTRRIGDAVKLCAETEQVGGRIITDLHGQRVQVVDMMDSVDETNREVTAGRAILNRIQRKIIQNKAIMYGMIVLLLIMIIIIVWVNL